MKINQKQETGNQKQKLFSLKFNVSSFQFASGQMMIIAIIFLAVILVLSAALFTSVAGFLRFGSNSILREQATHLAEAGIERTLWKLNQTAGACDNTCDDEITIGTTGTFKVTIQEKTPPNPNLKTIIATGYVPNATAPRAKRTVKADVLISTTTISFNYAVQVGNGGLTMGNGSSIKGEAGAPGNVYSNGNITGTSGTSISGEAWAVGTISPNYPTIGVPPPHPNSPVKDLPTLNYQQWKDAANINNDPETCTPTCTIDYSTSIGPKKYVGNLTLSNNATVTMTGPIYVTGNFTLLLPSTELILSNSFGSNGTVLIVDGTVTVNQGEIKHNNANPPGYILIASTSTSDNAIMLGNRGELAIFYALDGGVTLDNRSEVNVVVARKLTMNNNAELEYKSGFASTQFSSGPGGSWQIKRGTYRFTVSP